MTYESENDKHLARCHLLPNVIVESFLKLQRRLNLLPKKKKKRICKDGYMTAAKGKDEFQNRKPGKTPRNLPKVTFPGL
jgi:hypothetical protein